MGVSGVCSACDGWSVVVRDGLGRNGRDGLDVGCIAARRAYEGVLAGLRHREELLARRAAHRARRRLDDDVLEAEPVEDLHVRIAVRLVGRLEPLIVDVEGVGVLHDELASAQDAGTRTRFVAVLRLDLIEAQRQVLVGRVEVLDQEREHLLVRRAEQHVVALAVLEPEQVGAVVGPPPGQSHTARAAAAPGSAPPANRSPPSPRG